MAKRETGVGRHKKFHSYKTKKRLEAKAEMLRIKALRPSLRRAALKKSS